MESHFVSVFKLDGVPILPPLVNEEVRAAVAIYRQKAIEIEQRLQERRRTLAINNSVNSQLIDTNSSIVETNEEDEAQGDISEHKIELESGMANVSSLPTASVGENSSNLSEQSTITVPSEVLYESPQQAIVTVTETVEELKIDQSELDSNPLPDQMPSDVVKQPCWQSPTRTVTPTSEESMGWFPLVRSNTYNLEKPSIDLMNLHRGDHSTPIDRTMVDPSPKDRSKPKTPDAGSKPATPRSKVPTQRDKTPVKPQPIAFGISKTDRPHKSPKDQTKPIIDGGKCRPKRKSATRKISHSAAGSGVASDRALESVAQALTVHEQRMMELLKRQEEERLMLEQSFRDKTQELVALCAKSLTVVEDASSVRMPDCSRTKTPDINAASSVSQLSLCDVSYDSCTDTDDAAYQTCHANGTSEENVNNAEQTLTEEQPLKDGQGAIVTVSSVGHPTGKTQDNNGNDVISLLPQRMTELQQTKAATIINAYARGYLTRRLLKTEEVQGIKRTIADIICFIISSQAQAREDTNQAAIRRNAGKHIALCLDRLHDIFVNCTPQDRLQMIRRDRYLKSKSTLPKMHN